MEYRGAILDVDGTVVRGEQRLPDTNEMLTALPAVLDGEAEQYRLEP